MSQNVIIFNTSAGRVRVSAGWDNPLQEVFCNILPLDLEDEGEDQPQSGPGCSVVQGASFSSAEDVASLLYEKLGLVIPLTMQAIIDKDIAECARNVFRQFDEAGMLLNEQRL